MPHPRWNRLAALGLALILLAGALISPASAAAPTYESTILFTHDTHDHFLPMPDADGGESGGYTRLATRKGARLQTVRQGNFGSSGGILRHLPREKEEL